MNTTQTTATNSDRTRTVEVTINDQGQVLNGRIFIGMKADMEAVGWEFAA